MDKKTEYMACKMFDISFPNWDHVDHSGEPVITYPQDVVGVFKSICKRFTFYPGAHLNNPRHKSGITFSARIHLKVKKIPGTLRKILKEKKIMSTVSITPTERKDRAKEDGFYIVRDGAWTKLLGPVWVDDTKKQIDEKAKKAKEVKEAERAKKKAKREEKEKVDCGQPRAQRVDPNTWSWSPHFMLMVDAQTADKIDVLRAMRTADQVEATRYAHGLNTYCHYRSYSTVCKIEDLKDAVSKHGGVDDRGMPYVFDLGHMRSSFLAEGQVALDDEAVWDIIMGVKKGEVEGWEKSYIKNRVLVITDKEIPTKVYPGITIRKWSMDKGEEYAYNPKQQYEPFGMSMDEFRALIRERDKEGELSD